MCYLAPERLRAHFGSELKKADVWAVGMYSSLCHICIFFFNPCSVLLAGWTSLQ